MLERIKGMRFNYSTRLTLYFSLFGALPICLVCLLSFTLVRSTLVQSLRTQKSAELSAVNRQLTESIAGYEGLLDSLAQDEALLPFLTYGDQGSYYELNRSMYLLFQGQGSACSVYITSCTAPRSTGTQETPDAYLYPANQADWGLFRRENRALSQVAYIDLARRSQTRDLLFTIARPVYDGEILAGYLILDLNRGLLQRLMRDFDPSAPLFLYDQHGFVIYSSAGTGSEGFHRLGAALGSLEQDEGQDYEVLTKENGRTGYSLSVRLSLSAATEPASAILRALLVVLPIFLLGSVAVSHIMARHITKPILMMKDAMQRIKEGDFRQNITVHASTEIEEVVDAFNDMARQLDALVANIKEKQETLRIVELQNLKAQIKPHFLYNILDLIRWKAKLGEIDDVEKIIINLAKIMRASIDSQDDIVMVSQELDLVRRYCGLQQYLHKDLTVGFDIHPDVLSCRIPKLILQPIVENAIVHGVSHRSSGGVIHITAHREGEMLTFTVEDNGEGFTPPEPDAPAHGGIGLTNVNRRVKLYGGGACGLTVVSGAAGGATVLIRIRAIDREEGAI